MEKEQVVHLHGNVKNHIFPINTERMRMNVDATIAINKICGMISISMGVPLIAEKINETVATKITVPSISIAGKTSFEMFIG